MDKQNQIINDSLNQGKAIITIHHTTWRSIGMFLWVLVAAAAVFASYIEQDWLWACIFSVALVAIGFDFYHGASYCELRFPHTASKNLYIIQSTTLFAATSLHEAKLFAHLSGMDVDQVELYSKPEILQFTNN